MVKLFKNLRKGLSTVKQSCSHNHSHDDSEHDDINGNMANTSNNNDNSMINNASTISYRQMPDEGEEDLSHNNSNNNNNITSRNSFMNNNNNNNSQISRISSSSSTREINTSNQSMLSIPLATTTNTSNNNNNNDDSFIENDDKILKGDDDTVNNDDHDGSNNDISSRITKIKIHLYELICELLDYTRKKKWKKKVLTGVVVLSSACVFIDLIFFGNIVNWLNTCMFVYMENHHWQSVLLFIIIFIISALLFIPPSILIFGAGYAFTQASSNNCMWHGIIAATISSFIGSSLGATLAFLRARYMMRDLIYLFSKRYPIIKAVDTAIKKDGLRIMILLRLCPLIPFNALNYIGGITGIPTHLYIVSLIGLLPSTILISWIGASAQTLSHEHYGNGNSNQQLVSIILSLVGIVFATLSLVIVYFLAKQELQKEISMVKDVDNTTMATADMTLSSSKSIDIIGDVDDDNENQDQNIADRSSSSSCPYFRSVDLPDYNYGDDDDDDSNNHKGKQRTKTKGNNKRNYSVESSQRTILDEYIEREKQQQQQLGQQRNNSGGSIDSRNNRIEVQYVQGEDDEEWYWIWA